MGIVYKAFDTTAKRFVALKTLKGEVDRSALELFQREWSVLAQLSHPNIVDVLDIGDYAENGQQKPYFVMPLLPGCTLNKLIENKRSALTVERVVEIVCQAARGLQAAHDRGLIHRDLKPSNLFVMSDDTVKIIDFGIVHLADSESKTSIKGTLHYMAPEQLDLKPASARSDIYALGVVCYEALTGRKPFDRTTEEEVVEAIRSHMPPPVSDLNPAINEQVSRAVYKAMAKQPYHRFATVREFSDLLQRAHRNEHIEIFDRARIQPRINRINRALNEGDYQLAVDILDELQSEGNIDPEIPRLRMRAEQASRSRAIYQLIESARTRMEEEEYPLALQNVQRVLDIDPGNIDALALKGDIERQRSASQIEKWLQIGRQHRDNKLFAKARQAVDEVLRIDPSNRAAREMLQEVTAGEQEQTKLRQEKQRLYDAALKSYRNGEISSALKKLEEVIDLGKRAPGHPNTDAQYLAFYEEVRGERDELNRLYADGKSALAARNFAKALEVCGDVLRRRPGEPLFKALKIETEDLQRQENSAAIAQLHSQIEAELDLDRKYALLKEAVKRFPDEQMFSHSLKLLKERRELVNSVVSRARHYESQGHYSEASNQWDILRSVYPQYPGLDFEIQRLSRKEELHAREEAKARWVQRIDQAVFSGDYTSAEDLLRAALDEAPDDVELLGMQQQVFENAARAREASALLAEANNLVEKGDQPGAIDQLRTARALNFKDSSIAAALCSALVGHARNLAEQDWRAALPFVEEAMEINPADPSAASVARLLEDVRESEQIERYLLDARERQTQRNLTQALERVEQGLREYPAERRLIQLRKILLAAIASEAAETRAKSDTLPAVPAIAGHETADRTSDLWATTPQATLTPVQPPYTPPTVTAEPDLPPPPRDRLAERRALSPPRKLTSVFAMAAFLCVVILAIFIWGGKRTPKPVVGPPLVTAPRVEKKAAPQPPPPPPQPSVEDSKKVLQLTPPPEPRIKAPRDFPFDFNTDPSPARIVVDNDPRLSCPTPCTLKLSPGGHNVVARYPGFAQGDQVIEVPEQKSVSIPLHAELQSVRLASDPAGATVMVDGEPKGVTPVFVSLSVGKHQFVFSKDDSTVEQTFEVKPETPFFFIKLPRAQ